MKIISVFLLAACFACMAFIGSRHQNPLKNFIIIYTPGNAWDANKRPDQQAYFGFHSKHLSRLRKEGTIITGGRYSDKGMIIVKAVDENAARQVLLVDSAVIGNLFKAELFAYSVFYEGCITK